MNLLVFFALLVAAHAYGGDHDHCGTDCLKACRSCPELTNDGEWGPNGTSPFKVGARVPGDCDQLVCEEKNSVLIIEGRQYDRLVCFQGKWHFGYPQFLEEADSGMCLTPGNMTCDDDASVKFEDNFQCVCNPPFEDRTDDFDRVEQVCSNCKNKNNNIVLLVDKSGSMQLSLPAVKAFITTFVKFLRISPTGNRIALMTTSYSYDIKINWNDPESTLETNLATKLNAINADGQSYLGSGMEAVKAALVQPDHENGDKPHKLVVFTDGSVLHAPPRIQDITRAATKLEALGVETFVIATNNGYTNQQNAIANGVVDNVFGISTDPTADNFAIVNKLQKRICA